MKNIINTIQKNMTFRRTTHASRRFFGAMMMFAMAVSWAYGFIPLVSLNVKSVEASDAWSLRQEINIMNGYLGASSGAFATSSSIVQIDPAKYSGTEVYYFEVVASTSASIASNVYLKTTAGATVATAVIPLGTTNPTLIRSSAFTPNSSATDYVIVIGNESGATKSIKAGRVIILQSFAGSANSAATSTQTQIEIGNRELGKSNTTTSALSRPKYWKYDSSVWDGDVISFSAEVTYKNNGQIASTTTYTVPGSYTYVPTRGVSYAQVELWGAGGGGRCSTSAAGGGGGGGGAYARSTTTPIVGTSYALVVAATTTCNTTTSNDSTFDGTLVVADGGNGSGASQNGATGGSLANSTGQVRFAGGNGGNALGTNDTGGGGGGSAGPLGAGGNGSSGPSGATTSGGGGGGGNNGSSASNTATGAAGGAGGGTGGNGGASANGSIGASASEGGGGGSGSTALLGGAGGSPGGGGGGGDATASGTLGRGGRGQARITETHGTIGIAIEEDNGSFGGWTFKQMIVTNGAATSSAQRVRSASFTPVSGRHYRLVASTTNSGVTYDIYNAKIVINQSSDGFDIITGDPTQFSRLEPQYLLANTTLSSGTGLQSNLTKWDTTEWSGVNNTYIHQVDAAPNSTSVVTINQASGGTLVTGSTVTAPNNRGVSSAMTMPATGNLDTQATTNNGDVYASRILVQVKPLAAITGTVFTGLTGITSTLSGKTITAYKNGSTLIGSAVTNGDGQYTISVENTYNSEDIITVYIDGDTTKGVAVVKAQNSKSISDVNIYGSALTVRNNTFLSMSINDLLSGYVFGDNGDMVHEFLIDEITTLVLNQNVTLYMTRTNGPFAAGGRITTQGTGGVRVGSGGALYLDSGINIIAGNLLVDSGTLELFSDTQVGGSFIVTGSSSVSGSGTIIMTGVGSIETDFGLTVQNMIISSTATVSNFADITLNGALTVESSGSFTSSAGTVTLNSAGSSITNSGTLSFKNLTVAETPTTQPSTSFSITGALTVNSGKTFTPTSGTVTLNGGSVVNNGALSFYDLAISGSASTGSTFNVVNNLTSNTFSSFSTTGGLITVDGNLTLNGTVSGSGNVVVRGGDITGNGTLNFSSGVFTLQGIGSVGGNGNWTVNALDIGAPAETGEYQSAVVFGGQIYVSSDYGNTWTAKESNRNWVSIAVSATGQYQTAVVQNGQIYISSDYGNTWTAKESSRAWSQVAMSATGQYQTVALIDGGFIYVSSDYGNTWVAKSGASGGSGTADKVSMSATGQYQTATASSGLDVGIIFTSSDYGNTWTERSGPLVGGTISVSSTGQYQSFVVGMGGLWLSSDYGVTWVYKGATSGDSRQVSSSGDSRYITVPNGANYGVNVSADYGATWATKESSKFFYSSAVSSTGKYQAALADQIYVSSDFGVTWTPKESTRNWYAVAMSNADPIPPTGKYQTAVVYGGQIYVSSNYGNTWTAKESNRNWRSVAVSSSAQYQTAVAESGQIYISSDYGNTWTAKDSSRSWRSVSLSSTGQYQTAIDYFGKIYISSNYGNTWTAKDSNRAWFAVSISSTGQYQTAASAFGDQIYISSDYGNTWTAKDSARDWRSVSVSSTGQYQTAVVYGGQIYISSDYGNTWTAKDSNRNWYGVSVSFTGQYQTAVVNAGQLYISSDYGNTWTAKDLRNWNSVTVSSTGQYQSATVDSGQIYISSDYGNTWTAKDSSRSWTSISIPNSAPTTSVSTSGTGSITTSMAHIFNTFDLGSKVLELTSSFEPLKISGGTLTASSSTVKYSGTSNTTITPVPYYNLEFAPSSGTQTYTLGTTTGQTITVNNNLTLGGAGNLTVDADTRDPIINVTGNMTVGSGDTYQVSNTSTTTVTGDVSVTGTISGGGNMVVRGGDVTGNGTINLSSGTFTLSGTGSFGGSGNWNFSKLYIATSAPATSISALGSGSLTASTVSIDGTLDLGSKTLEITSSGAPLTISGTLVASSSTVKYSGSTNTTVTPATYYNLELAPSSGTQTYALGTTTGQTITVNNNLTLGGAGNVTVDSGTYQPTITINGNLTIGSGDTFTGSLSSALSLKGNFVNNGTFNANGGTVTFTTTTSSLVDSTNNMTFNNISATVPGATLKFKSRSGNTPTFTIGGTMTVTGTQSTPVYIESDSAGTQWLVNFLNPQGSITYASVRDAGCGIGSALVTSSATNVDRGNNDTCWNFIVISRGGGAAPSIGGESGGGSLITGGVPGKGQGQDAIEGGSGGGAGQSGGGQAGGGTVSP